ncbi:hypothetical protein F2Q69_00040821 [Brassica cretica]|uniref:Uncharacterized protein n=1 Tax=Brassica cretica TaxID=69181 RepID=A0A8S9NEZ6_BRACR|nr:hypothetical protein F2Q69_00040821 [Brassica cretica]
MRTLRFLRVYNTRCDTNVRVHLPEDMEFPPRLKLLHWEVYPRKFLPRTFCPEHLVELHLTDTQLEKLWEGTQPLTSLKKMVLVSCLCLKELPDLANATNLEILDVSGCQSLVEIHSSVGNLHRLQSLDMIFCKKLQVVPTLFNLTSLESLVIMGSYQMRELPDISTTIRELSIPETMLEEFLESTRLWSHLQCLEIFGCAITHQFMAHPSQRNLILVRSVTGIERIPACIKSLHGLKELSIYGCPKLASLPEIPRSLTTLTVYKCPSLETLEPFPFGSRIEDLFFLDCFRLGRKARRLITQQSSRVCLPGRNVPAEFHHRAIGNFLAICSNAYRFKICAVISPKQVMVEDQVIELLCHILINGCPMKSPLKNIFDLEITIQLEHLIIFPSTLLTVDRRPEQYSEILFEFSTTSQDIEVIECGVQILRDKTDIRSSYGSCESNSEQLLELEDDLDYDAPRGSRSLMGISLDISTIKDDMDISARVFKSMRTLRFLRVYNTRSDTNVRVHLPEDMEFPPRLKLLHWEVYPRKFLPRTFCPEHLVELHLEDTQLEQLWEGTQPLTSLKKMVLDSCLYLKELPDLANATNLEILDLSRCKNLVEIHSSVGNLHRLQSLEMVFCKKLQVVPTLFNLTSLESLVIMGSYQMRELPDISTTIRELAIPETMLEEFLESTRLWSHFQFLRIFGCAITHQFLSHPSKRNLMLVRSVTGIERIPDCIKCLHGLKDLYIFGCAKLASLPEVPRSLTTLIVYKCPSLETLEPFPFGSRIEDLSFLDCFRLGRKARRLITQQSSRVCLPGRNVPAEFHHRAIGNFVAICSNAYRFKICAVISPKQVMVEDQDIELLCHILINGCPMKSPLKNKYDLGITIQSEHLFIFPSTLLTVDRRPEQYSEILFEFSTTSQDIEVIECGVQILRDKTDIRSSYGSCESNSEQLLELEDDLDYDAPRVDTIKDFANFYTLATVIRKYTWICKSQFGKAYAVNPVGELSNLRHTGTVDEYCSQFEECLSRQTRLSGDQQLWQFCAGLTDNLRKEVEYFRPETIFEAMEFSRDNEYKIDSDK